jgi:hypothetical protein
MWNCYLAKIDTMADATLLGSIRLVAVKNSSAVRDEFKAAMRSALEVVLEDSTGLKVSKWVEEPGPDHERGGNA